MNVTGEVSDSVCAFMIPISFDSITVLQREYLFHWDGSGMVLKGVSVGLDES